MIRSSLAIFGHSEVLLRVCNRSYAKFTGGKLGGGVSSKFLFKKTKHNNQLRFKILKKFQN